MALLWLVFPGFGLTDLAVTWNPDWPVMLEAGWGMLVTAGLGSPMVISAWRPHLASLCLVQLSVVSASLFVAAVASLEPQMWWMFVLAAPSLALLTALRQRFPALVVLVHTRRRSYAQLALAAIAAPFALAYAWNMAAANRTGPPVDITVGVDHYAVQAALGLAVIALPVVAGWWAPARRLLGTSAALMAGYCGLVSYNWPGAAGGWGAAVSLGAMAWAVVVGAVVWWPRDRSVIDQRVAARSRTP